MGIGMGYEVLPHSIRCVKTQATKVGHAVRSTHWKCVRMPTVSILILEYSDDLYGHIQPYHYDVTS